MSSFEKNVILLGSIKDTGKLTELVDVINTDEIVELIHNRIASSDFVTFFFFLLDGFSDEPQSHEKRYKVVEAVLKEVHKQTVSNRQAVSICGRIVIELRKFNNVHLLKLCTFCTRCIQKADSSETNSWKNIFPQLLNILVEMEAVEYNDEEMTGAEYKSQLISSLTMLDWSANIITELAEMFNEMPLTKDEHLQIINKLLTSLEALTPQEIPPFVYQLLKLCENLNGKVLFFKLQQFFDNLNYKSLITSEHSSESMDFIESSENIDTKQAESMVIFHVYNSASNGEESVTEYLNALKNMTKSPEYVLRPFQLTVLLTISTLNFYEEKVFDIIKASISRFYTEQYKAATSKWLRDLIPKDDHLLPIIVQIINSSSKEKDLILQGLINLSFVLLESGAQLGRESIVENLWDIGKKIIVQLIRQKTQFAYVILSRICINISTATQNIQRYIECLHTITRKFGLVLLENHSCTIQLLEIIIQVPCSFANDILEAILPLCRISFTIRDHLILFLRKALNLRDMETRQVVVCGFLKLLKHLKISNLSALSQQSGSSSSSSSLSIMTQIVTSTQSNKSPFTNEALCLEVLGILTRCFIQQSKVKVKLYEGLYGVVLRNKELAPSLLKIMAQHFMQFYEPDEDIVLPLKFSKILQTKGTEVILTEPLGNFLYSAGLIIQVILEGEIEHSSVETFLKIYKGLSERLSKADLEQFELNDGTDLLDITPESQEKLLILKTAISVHEALIGFNIFSWRLEDENAKIILGLFQGYNRLIQFSKTLSKHKKGDKGKKDDTNKTTQTQNTTKSGGSSKNTFKLPDPIIDFNPIQKLITLLHSVNVPWASANEANILKRNVEFHVYALNSSVALFQHLKHSKTVEIEKKATLLKHCEIIGGVLYKRCIVRYEEFKDFDLNCAILSLECFYIILQTVEHHFSKSWTEFFKGICENSAGVSKNVEDILNVYKDLFKATQEDSFQDSDVIRVALVLLNTISLLSLHISLPITSTVYMQKLADWTREMCIEMKITGKVAISLVALTFNLNKKFKPTVDFLKKASMHLKTVLGSVTEEDDEVTCTQVEIGIINEGTAAQILTCLCNEVKTLIDDIDYIILRLRSESVVVSYRCSGDIDRRRDKLLEKERSTCVQISQIISLITVLSNISLGPGQQFESVIRISTNLFSSLTNLAKYFMAKSSKINLAFEAARFDGVVKQAGKKLSRSIYTLIEESQKEPEEASTSKKKKDASELKSKVLRETRLIPKLIYEMEQFSKTVIQLSKKTKVDLSKYMGQGTTRDFRILNLNDVIEETGGVIEASQCTTILEATLDENSSHNRSEVFSDEDDPPAKKTKKN